MAGALKRASHKEQLPDTLDARALHWCCMVARTVASIMLILAHHIRKNEDVNPIKVG